MWASLEMCFKGSCDVTNEAERWSTPRRSTEGWVAEWVAVLVVGGVDWVLMWRREVREGCRHGNPPWCW